MNISDKKKAGEILGREGISERIIRLATDISLGGYKDAIRIAGQISVLVEAARYDSYWKEKSALGMQEESGILSVMLEGDISRDRVCKFSNPMMPGDK